MKKRDPLFKTAPSRAPQASSRSLERKVLGGVLMILLAMFTIAVISIRQNSPTMTDQQKTVLDWQYGKITASVDNLDEYVQTVLTVASQSIPDNYEYGTMEPEELRQEINKFLAEDHPGLIGQIRKAEEKARNGNTHMEIVLDDHPIMGETVGKRQRIVQSNIGKYFLDSDIPVVFAEGLSFELNFDEIAKNLQQEIQAIKGQTVPLEKIKALLKSEPEGSGYWHETVLYSDQSDKPKVVGFENQRLLQLIFELGKLEHEYGLSQLENVRVIYRSFMAIAKAVDRPENGVAIVIGYGHKKDIEVICQKWQINLITKTPDRLLSGAFFYLR